MIIRWVTQHGEQSCYSRNPTYLPNIKSKFEAYKLNTAPLGKK
jgi:hypothetical protein